jgi:PAS domain S-box-containing protein
MPQGHSQGHERRLRMQREIAEGKQDDNLLQETEQRLEQVVANFPGMLFQIILPTTGRIRLSYVSDQVSEYLGYTPEEVTRDGRNPLEMVYPDQQEEAIRQMRTSAETLEEWSFEGQVRHANETVVWLRTRATPSRMSTGDIVWNGVAFDVTEQKRAEEQLRTRDSLLQKLSEQVPGVIYQYQQWPDGRSCFPYASKGIAEIYEVTPEEVRESAELVFGRLHPDDFDVVAERIRHSLETMETWSCKYRVCLPERGIRWLDGHSVPERMPDGSTLWHGYIRDVTERVLVEAEVRRSHDAVEQALTELKIESARAEQFRRLCERAGQGIGISRLDGTITYLNPAFCRLLELSDDAEFTRHAFWQFVPSEEHPFLSETVLQTTRQTGSWSGRFNLLTRTGKRVPIINTVFLLRDMDGTVAGYSNIATDISELVQTEQELKESRERLRIFIENAPAGVAMLDRELRYISCSRRWLTDYGLGDQNLVGQSHYDVFPEITDRWKEIHRRCLTGISESCEEDRFDRADGTVDILRWEVQPWTDASGEVGGLVFFTELITERVRAEERIRASLREKESMLKEIHHRVKNNLQVISSLLSLQSISVTHPAATAVLAESQNRVRAMALVHETLYRSEDLAQVDLSKYLAELCGYLLRTYGIDSDRIKLVMNMSSVPVSLDKSIPCGLIVNEIVSNSLKYAFPGTRSGRVTVKLDSEADGRIAIILADDGIGLPNDFDIARNQSLGLQLVGMLTQQLGGHLTVERNGGTQFTIRFLP